MEVVVAILASSGLSFFAVAYLILATRYAE